MFAENASCPLTPKMDVKVVPFSSQHVEAVGALIVGIQRDEFQIPITLEDQPDLQDIPNFYQRGAGNFWVAISEGEVVGTVALLDIGNQRGALRKMFVHLGYRGPGHGVSARLLATLLDWSRAREVKEIYLGTTEKFLAAHRFYERNRFQQIAATVLPPSFPKMALDTVLPSRPVVEAGCRNLRMNLAHKIMKHVA
ncbi:MAG: GNAT family N-acetyltransferase [Chthoniobacterales bacterium]